MVKPGYKQTEICLIPEDWDCAKFGEKVKIYRGGSPRPIQNYITHLSTGINWIKIGDVGENDKYIRSTQEKIIPEGVSKSREVHVGDFILSNSMSFGRPYILDIDGCIHDGWLTIQEYKNTFHTEYLYYLLSSNLVYQQYISMAAGSSVKNLNKDKVSALNVIYPTLLEQERIAKALSEVDSMVSSLEKLIAKKKAVKQGAMQELLTGKKRLPGFSGEWNKINLAKKSKIKARIGWQGLTTNEYLDSGYSYLVTGTDFVNGKIDWDNCHYVAKDRFDQDKNIQIQNDDILITKDGSLGKTALVKGLDKPATLNSGVFVIRPIQESYDPAFVYYILSSFVFKDFLDHLSAGSTIIHLYQKDISKFEFLIPPTIEEQTAIASILSDMDNEIEALDQKLQKARCIKQGMMQQLLTGKIRLASALAESKSIEAVSKPHHNHQFDDAVVIAAIVNEFYNDTIPLGRKKVQKLLYLLRRKQEADTSAFKKKAAGPYADEVRYKGGEPIAIRSKYVEKKQGAKGTTFSKGEKIESALEYIEKWEMTDDINWLVSTFKYTKTNDLELFATIDMAICDLINSGEAVSVASIKDLIASNKEWKDKLSKTYFSDNDIARAIRFCRSTFN